MILKGLVLFYDLKFWNLNNFYIKKKFFFAPQGDKPPPIAPRQLRQVQLQQSISKDVASGGLGNPMATNHFLREGFRYSRKGLNIDKWSRYTVLYNIW